MAAGSGVDFRQGCEGGGKGQSSVKEGKFRWALEEDRGAGGTGLPLAGEAIRNSDLGLMIRLERERRKLRPKGVKYADQCPIVDHRDARGRTLHSKLLPTVCERLAA